MDRKLLEILLSSLKKFITDDSEFTIEINPDSIDADKLSLFMDKGVNRISIGTQSFNDDKLKRLGRIHDSGLAKKCVESVHHKGFKNIGIDMIFGVWNESIDAWKGDLEMACQLPVTHLSCYSLTCEKNTLLWKSVEEGRIAPIEDKLTACMYDYAISTLPDKGFIQDEISNFSKEGFSCRHNLTYWRNDPYMALGASAVSFVEGIRQKNISDVVEYIDRVTNGKNPIVSSEKLTPEKSAKETAALKIRTMEGVDFNWFEKKTGFEFLKLEEAAMPKLINDGLIEYCFEHNRIRLTRRGILFCDIVSGAFL